MLPCTQESNMRHVLFWVFGLSLLQIANAQEAELPLDETYATANLETDAPALLEVPPGGPKKIPDAALGLSMGLTALSLIIGGELAGVGKNAELPALQFAGLGIVTGGLILFPSAGHLYAQDKKRARNGIALRASSVLLGGALLLLSSRNESTAIDAIVFGTTGILGALTLIDATLDVADSERAAKRYNERVK
jgi:hypothetical protein